MTRYAGKENRAQNSRTRTRVIVASLCSTPPRGKSRTWLVGVATSHKHGKIRSQDGEGPMSKNTITTGAAGEHFVMYRLLSLGHFAALTPTGAEGVDILLSDAEGGHLAAIQVKTAGSRVSVGWQMNAKHERLRSPRLFYCFVDPGEQIPPSPSCWIVPSAVVAEHVYATHRAWLAGAPKRGSSRQDSPKRTLHLRCTNPPMPAYPDNWMDEYREAWHLLDVPS